MQIVARLYYETDELFPEVLDRALIQFKSLLIDWVIPNWLAEHIHRIGKNSSIWYVHVCNVECTPFAILFHLFHGSNLWRQKRKYLKALFKSFSPLHFLSLHFYLRHRKIFKRDWVNSKQNILLRQWNIFKHIIKDLSKEQ